MFEETLEPLIRRPSEGIIVSQILRFVGISEEELADEVLDLLEVVDPTVAPLVGPGEVGVGEVDLRVTTRALTREEAKKKMEPVVEEILSRLSGYYLGDYSPLNHLISDGGRLSITSTVNGPPLLRGGVEIRNADSETVYRGSKSTLCRCGYSNNKPFCDGSHAKMNWRDD